MVHPVISAAATLFKERELSLPLSPSVATVAQRAAGQIIFYIGADCDWPRAAAKKRRDKWGCSRSAAAAAARLGG